MDADDYQQQALRSALLERPKADQLLNAIVGLAGESGEICDLWKKWQFHGHSLDHAKLQEELGDLLWYVALACYALDCSMSSLMEANIAKLFRRYPEKFSFERSINRE